MTVTAARTVLEQVTDPEIPVLTIADIGMLRDVLAHDDGTLEVVITPTYSGCPAMDEIRADIVRALAEAGYPKVTVTTSLSPAWTTDWMTEQAKEKLREYGIAPPTGVAPAGPVHVTLSTRPPDELVACPRCGERGREVSRFGSTACKSMYVCTACLEPFDYFKSL
ncbi:MAG TPA: phenylacetate-CoA oxygenase subunit PaaJ [Dermatophilaceae bacterium]|nr:phenylacetate-CoA oxygenase subunit PaaJ [Dermatophilaceae bacterium]